MSVRISILALEAASVRFAQAMTSVIAAAESEVGSAAMGSAAAAASAASMARAATL